MNEQTQIDIYNKAVEKIEGAEKSNIDFEISVVGSYYVVNDLAVYENVVRVRRSNELKYSITYKNIPINLNSEWSEKLYELCEGKFVVSKQEETEDNIKEFLNS